MCIKFPHGNVLKLHCHAMIFVYRVFFCLQLEINLSVSCLRMLIRMHFLLLQVFFFFLSGEIKDVAVNSTSFIYWKTPGWFLSTEVFHYRLIQLLSMFTYSNWIQSISYWISTLSMALDSHQYITKHQAIYLTLLWLTSNHKNMVFFIFHSKKQLRHHVLNGCFCFSLFSQALVKHFLSKVNIFAKNFKFDWCMLSTSTLC